MILYKYQSIDEFFWKNLFQSSIWFNTPLNFDDDYDGQIPLNLDYSPFEIELLLRISYLTNFKTQFGFEENFGKMAQFLNDNPKEKENFLAKYFEDHTREKIGITCFSINNSNSRLWADYSKRSTGICLEFDTKLDPDFFNPLEKVKYIPELKMVKLNIQDLPNSLREVYTTKHIDWDDQEEYRIFKRSLGAYFYEPSSLRSITFGTRTDKKDRNKIISIGLLNNPQMNFYERIKEKGSYSVVKV